MAGWAVGGAAVMVLVSLGILEECASIAVHNEVRVL
jgi:hypothetical protein